MRPGAVTTGTPIHNASSVVIPPPVGKRVESNVNISVGCKMFCSAAVAKQCHAIGRDALFRKRAHNGVPLLFKQPILQSKARVGNGT